MTGGLSILFPLLRTFPFPELTSDSPLPIPAYLDGVPGDFGVLVAFPKQKVGQGIRACLMSFRVFHTTKENLAAPVLVAQHQGAETPQLCPVEAVHPID